MEQTASLKMSNSQVESEGLTDFKLDDTPKKNSSILITNVAPTHSILAPRGVTLKEKRSTKTETCKSWRRMSR